MSAPAVPGKDGGERVLQVAYCQSLTFNNQRPGWSESLDISVRIRSQAITGGWCRQHFSAHPGDLLVLLALAMHARPLYGADLCLLVRLGLAQPQDEGRLYARVSDVGLAGELGIGRKGAAAGIRRLERQGLVRVLHLPRGETFRDSHGEFAGCRLYLLAGEAESMLEKDIAPSVAPAEPSPAPAETTDHGLCGPTPCAARAINIDSDSDEDEEGRPAPVGLPVLSETEQHVFAHFARRRGDVAYRPKESERQALRELLAQGYRLAEDILPGIERSLARAPGRVNSFNYCAQAVLSESRPRCEAAPVAAPDSPAALALGAAGAQVSPAAQGGETGAVQTVLPDAAAGAAQDVFSPGLGSPAPQDLLVLAGQPLTRPALARLHLMAARAAPAALQAGSSGETWLADALLLGLGVAASASLLNYADSVLSGWIAHGRPPPPEHACKKPARTARRPAQDARQVIRQYMVNRSSPGHSQNGAAGKKVGTQPGSQPCSPAGEQPCPPGNDSCEGGSHGK